MHTRRKGGVKDVYRMSEHPRVCAVSCAVHDCSTVWWRCSCAWLQPGIGCFVHLVHFSCAVHCAACGMRLILLVGQLCFSTCASGWLLAIRPHFTQLPCYCLVASFLCSSVRCADLHAPLHCPPLVLQRTHAVVSLWQALCTMHTSCFLLFAWSSQACSLQDLTKLLVACGKAVPYNMFVSAPS